MKKKYMPESSDKHSRTSSHGIVLHFEEQCSYHYLAESLSFRALERMAGEHGDLKGQRSPIIITNYSLKIISKILDNSSWTII